MISMISRITVRISATTKYHVGGNFLKKHSHKTSPGNRKQNSNNTGNNERSDIPTEKGSIRLKRIRSATKNGLDVLLLRSSCAFFPSKLRIDALRSLSSSFVSQLFFFSNSSLSFINENLRFYSFNLIYNKQL